MAGGRRLPSARGPAAGGRPPEVGARWLPSSPGRRLPKKRLRVHPIGVGDRPRIRLPIMHTRSTSAFLQPPMHYRRASAVLLNHMPIFREHERQKAGGREREVQTGGQAGLKRAPERGLGGVARARGVVPADATAPPAPDPARPARPVSGPCRPASAPAPGPRLPWPARLFRHPAPAPGPPGASGSLGHRLARRRPRPRRARLAQFLAPPGPSGLLASCHSQSRPVLARCRRRQRSSHRRACQS